MHLIPSAYDLLPCDFTTVHPILPISLVIYSLKNIFLPALEALYFRIRASTQAPDSPNEFSLYPPNETPTPLQYDHERTTYTTSTKSTTATTETRKEKQALPAEEPKKKIYILYLSSRTVI
ncbi:hypothetical protein ASPVEDRAFT_821028 [Aspergillus versicolor CBS 583.65]|uniref:Uncharacterized protein n=1 Tax=Aspergillus versicolor CBS 583.65 TaxID=1036611 RepID=A0A1L9PTR0_ASPVE|nr:uncharacterized protein ASPVEDRAFT_821028 [Aspergillus versicolor CBS 583.65]OJJ04908.1 hypothetical protein ASPVEDRAFT_821028 [Aspergillus versicolor CBS 583.65]